jgi:ABC-type uncharacterized transport system ATPase subunit
VAGGLLRDLKRASGRQSVRIALDGPSPSPDWLERLPGVDIVRRDATGAELELLPGAEPAAILADMLARDATISRFEVVEPSLEALFIELVGRPADDDTGEAGLVPGTASEAAMAPAAGGPG